MTIQPTPPETTSAQAWTPPDAPLDMPTQDLWRSPQTTLAPDQPRSGETDGWRIGMIALTLVMIYYPAKAFYDVLSLGGLSFLDALTLVLFVLLFGWLAFAFVMAGTGFCLMATEGAATLAEPARPNAPPLGRTALLMPIFHEDVAAVFARLYAIDQSLAAEAAKGPGADAFDIFILSDSQDAGVKVQERDAVLALRGACAPGRDVFYRNRTENVGRKAGNIADWVRRFGAAYETMVVLDADSLMSGEILIRLAADMARQPRLGLIQTVPLIVNRSTVFARFQQFASRLYGPMLSEGLAWWSGAEGNYWGHNAIIRTRAFAEQAGLPRLPGRKPFGGEILSHDFVEAALLRRGGWEVRMAPQLYGSFEECPPTLPDLIVRERRWCQGNLQHSIVITARGLHWNSRLHLIRGVSAYLTAPLSLVFILAGALQTVMHQTGGGGQWGLASLRISSWVFSVGLGILIAPKLMSLALVLVDERQRRAWGDPVKLCLGCLLETLLAALIAPILMLAEAQALIDVIRGRDSGWKAQSREEGDLSWRGAIDRHGLHTLAGLVLGVAAFATSKATFLWMAPVVVGLLAAVPVARITASADLGLWLKAKGYLITPEERDAPPILGLFQAAARAGRT
jgi:membrane glycosyltransferase